MAILRVTQEEFAEAMGALQPSVSRALGRLDGKLSQFWQARMEQGLATLANTLREQIGEVMP